jgi:hypothetical protein
VDLVLDPDATVEGDEVGTATEEHMLTVVDDFVDSGMKVGGGAAAEVAAAFNEMHSIAALGECAGSAHAGDAATYDCDRLRLALLR